MTLRNLTSGNAMCARDDRANVVGVRVGSVAALLVAGGLLILPVAPLSCDESDAASMACCKGDMAGCNRPGKTEDCCRKNIAGRETALDFAKASRADEPGAVSPDAFVVTHTSPTVSLEASAIVRGCPRVPHISPSPPRSGVLRL